MMFGIVVLKAFDVRLFVLVPRMWLRKAIPCGASIKRPLALGGDSIH